MNIKQRYACALFFVLLSLTALHAQIRDARTIFAERGIQTQSFAEAGFMDRAQSSMTLGERKAVEPLLQNSIFVSNNGQKSILHMTVTAEIINSSGDVVYSIIRTGNLESRSWPRLAPGQTQLLTLDPDVNRMLAKRQRTDQDVQRLTQLVSASPALLQLKATGSTVKASILDSIILEDGEVIGPDRFGVIEEAKAKQQALQSLATSLENGGSESTTELIAGLEKRTQQYSESPKLDGKFDYQAFAEANFAGLIVGFLKSGRSQSEVVKWAHMVLQRMEENPTLFKSPR
jgi:hypothetical protein